MNPEYRKEDGEFAKLPTNYLLSYVDWRLGYSICRLIVYNSICTDLFISELLQPLKRNEFTVKDTSDAADYIATI